MEVKIKRINGTNIDAIKAIRSVTALGLKESKEIVDSVKTGNEEILETIDISDTDAARFLNLGCIEFCLIWKDEVQQDLTNPLEKLKELTVSFMQSGELSLVVDLVQVMERYIKDTEK